MLEKLLKYIVIILAILIFIAFFILLYGMYYKISSKSYDILEYPNDISLILGQDDKIENFQIIDEQKILVTVRSNNELIGLIYDINSNKIIQRISK